MSSPRFFKDDFMSLIESFYKAVSNFKETHDSKLFFEKLTHPLEEKRDEESKHERVHTGLDFLSEVVNKYAVIVNYKRLNEKDMPPVTFANAVANTVFDLKRDIEIYLSADITAEDKELCDNLLNQMESISANISPYVEEAKKFAASPK